MGGQYQACMSPVFVCVLSCIVLKVCMVCLHEVYDLFRFFQFSAMPHARSQYC